MTPQSQPVAGAASRLNIAQAIKTLVTLFKMRVVALLLLASLGGAFLGARGVPELGALVVLLLTGALAAGGASAINQYLERDTDTMMRRTRARPLATGQIQQPTAILWIALVMILLAVFSVLPSNPAMGFYLALGALIYVGVYTIWLKPRSILNIVIGGAAGSCAVMTGGAAVGAASDPGVIALALLLFLWTPAHFWALALMHKDDYATAGIPMLPVEVSPVQTAWWIFAHAASTSLAALVLAVAPGMGLIYFIPAALMTAILMRESIHLISNPERKQAVRLFVTSNIFLALVLVVIMLAAAGNQLLLS